MDSTIIIIQHIVTDTLGLDSLNKLSGLKNIVVQGQQPTPTSPTFNTWLPLLSAVIVGLIVLIPQHFDRRSKRNTDRKNALREIYAYCRKLEQLMKNNYRELAMAKMHVEYWWYCNATTNGEDKGRYYEEHLRSQALSREIERKIGETKADFIGHVRKFQALKEVKPEIESQLLIISDLTNAKAKTYDITLPHDKIRYEKAEQDEKELREIYYANLKHFESINDYLYQELK
jgi:hypothetical protein